MFKPDPDEFLSWVRYLFWSERLLRDFNRYTENTEEPRTPEWLSYHLYWAASLYVVIEGWESLGYPDPIINNLLQRQDWKDSLRKLRNGTFHYQPSLISPKLVHFLKSDPQIGLWLFTLHHEFCRYFRNWLDQFRCVPEEFIELCNDVTEMVGWIPGKYREDLIASVNDKKNQIQQILRSGKAGGCEAEFREAIGKTGDGVEQSEKLKIEDRRNRLLKLGVPALLVNSQPY